MMFLKKLNNIKILKIFLFFSFAICLFSISTSFEDLLIFKEETIFNFKVLTNFFRHFLVYFCLLSLLLIMVNFKKSINFKKYWIFYIFLVYLVFQIPGLLLTNNNLTNISLIICTITTVFTLIMIDNFFTNNEKKILLLFLFITLSLVFLISFTPKFIEFLKGGDIFYGVHSNSVIYLGKSSPRSSGLARTALIIFILINLFESFSLKKINILSIVKTLLLIAILLFQSRTTIFLTLIVIALIFLNQKNISLKITLKFLLFYLVIPIIMFIILSTLNSKNKIQNTLKEKSDISIFEVLNSNKTKILRNISKDDPSSGRFGDWKEILDNFSYKNIIFGYGVQGDRYLINQSASNGLIYALASSGLTGLIFFIFFSISVGFKSLKIIFYYLKRSIDNILYSTVIIVLGLRSILETGYAVFGLDQIIFLTFLIFTININLTNINSNTK